MRMTNHKMESVEIISLAEDKRIIFLFIIRGKLTKQEIRKPSKAMSHGKRCREDAHGGAHHFTLDPSKAMP